MRRTLVSRHLIVVALLLAAVAHLSAQASVIYVDSSATGGDNGTSWVDAYADLQTALGTASPPDSIWVAEGTDYPSSAGNRDSTFQLLEGVAVYGGFAGGETSVSQRDWAANVTVLSGDIGVVDDDTDNSYSVSPGAGPVLRRCSTDSRSRRVMPTTLPQGRRDPGRGHVQRRRQSHDSPT